MDYLITPALGGADDIRNLWPQPYAAPVWNARVKDALEYRLRDMVCDGGIELGEAQREIATNWIAAYKKYFHTEEPLLQTERAANEPADHDASGDAPRRDDCGDRWAWPASANDTLPAARWRRRIWCSSERWSPSNRVFLNRWNDTSQTSLRSLNDAFIRAQEHPSPDALAQLKDAYVKTFPEAPADRKKRVQDAKTAAGVAAAFYSNIGRGMRVRFHVRTLFKHQDDDDDVSPTPAISPKNAKDDDDDRKGPAGAKKPTVPTEPQRQSRGYVRSVDAVRRLRNQLPSR